MAKNFLKRTFFHPGKTKCEEQKREASEKYEERCEPSINKLTGSRYCKTNKIAFSSLYISTFIYLSIGPDIKSWAAFQNYEVGSGYGR